MKEAIANPNVVNLLIIAVSGLVAAIVVLAVYIRKRHIGENKRLDQYIESHNKRMNEVHERVMKIATESTSATQANTMVSQTLAHSIDRMTSTLNDLHINILSNIKGK